MAKTAMKFFTGFLTGKYQGNTVFFFRKILTVVFALCTLTACVTSTAPQKSNLTPGVVKKRLQKGVTSQAEIIRLIGAPNIVTKNKVGEEVWTYSRQSFDSESGGFGGSLLFFGGAKAFSSASSNSFDLIITFDENDIVKDYSVVSSQF